MSDTVGANHIASIIDIIKPHLKSDANIDSLKSRLSSMKFNVLMDKTMYQNELNNWATEKRLLRQTKVALSKKVQQLYTHSRQVNYSPRSREILSPVVWQMEKLEGVLADCISNDFKDFDHRGVKEDYPFNTFVYGLCRMWFKFTGKQPTQTLDIETPFKQFAHACFEALEDKNIFQRKLTDDSIRDVVRQYLKTSTASK